MREDVSFFCMVRPVICQSPFRKQTNTEEIKCSPTFRLFSRDSSCIRVKCTLGRRVGMRLRLHRGPCSPSQRHVLWLSLPGADRISRAKGRPGRCTPILARRPLPLLSSRVIHKHDGLAATHFHLQRRQRERRETRGINAESKPSRCLPPWESRLNGQRRKGMKRRHRVREEGRKTSSAPRQVHLGDGEGTELLEIFIFMANKEPKRN